MSDLPEAQSALFEPPFTDTGVDRFAPITIERGKKTRASTATDKRYGVFFTCLTYRAIHLETAGDLSTDCFIMALQSLHRNEVTPEACGAIMVKTLSEQIESSFY